jgi:hypothetical protein
MYLHTFIDYLNQRNSYPQWLLLLATWELSPRDWIERRLVLDSISISKDSSNVSSVTQTLIALGLIEAKKTRTGPTVTSCQIRLTPDGRAEIKAALKLAKLALKPTSTIEPLTH